MSNVIRNPDQIIDRPKDDQGFRDLCDLSNNSNERNPATQFFTRSIKAYFVVGKFRIIKMMILIKRFDN